MRYFDQFGVGSVATVTPRESRDVIRCFTVDDVYRDPNSGHVVQVFDKLGNSYSPLEAEQTIWPARPYDGFVRLKAKDVDGMMADIRPSETTKEYWKAGNSLFSKDEWELC